MGKKRDKRDDFLMLVPQQAQRIFDVGCGRGVIGQKLKKKGKEVIGVEKDKVSADAAKEVLDEAYWADVQTFNPPYPDKYFDCILYADILEHLIDPVEILKKHRAYLTDEGCIVASIPNVRYYRLMYQVFVRGVWDYTEKGILDRTHLRFFTLKNIQELFSEAGFAVVEIQRNIVAKSPLRGLNRILCGTLRDVLTYQYYIKTKKSNRDSRSMGAKRRIETL